MMLVLAYGPARGETLADAVAQAYRGNPTIEGSRYDLRATDEAVVQARSELRPQVQAQVTGGYDRTVEGRVTSAANPLDPEAYSRNSDLAEFDIVQPIYTGGKATADRARAQAQVRAGRETLRGSEGDLLLGVITAYVDVRRYAAALDVWHASIAELEKLNTEIRARREAGELTLTDIALADSQLEIAREQAVATEQSLEGARADYAQLVGHDPGALEDMPALPRVPRDIDTAFDLAERLSPDLAQTRYTELASREAVVAARAAGNPTISLRGTATLGGQAAPYHLRDQDQGYGGSVVLTVPISAGGYTASLVRQAEDQNGSDRFRIEAARRALMRNISNAWNQVVTAGRIATLLEAQHHAAIIQLDGMISEYRVGLRSTFDVLYAQQTLRDVEVSLLQSRRDRYVSEATLLRETGLLEARDILTGIELYDPAAHLRHVVNDNALPWEGMIAALDRAGTPRARQRRLQQPGAASMPLIAPASLPVPGDAPLSRSRPVTPIPGTIASSGGVQ